MKKLALLTIALLAATVAPALAATSSTTVDIGPLISALVNDYGQLLINTVVVAAAGWLALLLAKYTGIKIDQSLLNTVDAFGEKQAGIVLAKVVNAKEFNIDVKNPVIAAAAAAAEAQIPGVLRQLGVTPAGVEAYVGDFIVKHLGLKLAGEPDQPTPAGAIPGTNVTADGKTVAAAPAAPAAPAAAAA